MSGEGGGEVTFSDAPLLRCKLRQMRSEAERGREKGPNICYYCRFNSTFRGGRRRRRGRRPGSARSSRRRRRRRRPHCQCGFPWLAQIFGAAPVAGGEPLTAFKKPDALLSSSSTFNGIITRPKIAGSILRDDRFIVSAPNHKRPRALNSHYGDGMQRRRRREQPGPHWRLLRHLTRLHHFCVFQLERATGNWTKKSSRVTGPLNS